MKKKLSILLLFFSVLFLASCSQKEAKATPEKATTTDNALMYTFTMDDHDYRFRLLDGWIKYPNDDSSIAFLVGNKDIKSFMTAGFESKEKSLDEYKDDFLKKLVDARAEIIIEPKKQVVNGLDSYNLSFTMKDNKDRLLTYRTSLIESDGYFVNLAAWTSQENPSEETLAILDTMLGAFEQLK